MDVQVKLLTGSAETDHFGHHIIPQALESNHKVVAHNFDGYWRVSAELCVQPRLHVAPTCKLKSSWGIANAVCWLCPVCSLQFVLALPLLAITCLCPQPLGLLDTVMSVPV